MGVINISGAITQIPRHPDGYWWEVAWGPMFEFSDNGELRFKAFPDQAW